MIVGMPFDACLTRLDAHCGGELLAGAAPATLCEEVRDGRSDSPYAEALRLLLDWVPVRRLDQTVTRSELVLALGPLRLRYQAQEAPLAEYRALTRLIHAIDAVYDERKMHSH